MCQILYEVLEFVLTSEQMLVQNLQTLSPYMESNPLYTYSLACRVFYKLL